MWRGNSHSKVDESTRYRCKVIYRQLKPFIKVKPWKNYFLRKKPRLTPAPAIPVFAGRKLKAMNIDNTSSQMRKGVLEFCILSVIKQGEAYPSDIIDQMKAANLNIFEGTLYPLLTRLKNAELLSYRWVESNSGPPRKYFSLTDKGAQFYNELEATWNELANAVQALTKRTE